MNYQTLIIGTGADAVAAAIRAAEQGERVALVEPPKSGADRVTIADLKEAVDRLMDSGLVSMSALRYEVARSIRCRRAADRAQLACVGVDIFTGDVQFLNSTTVMVGDGESVLNADSIVLACGTRPAAARHLPLNGRSVIHAESLLELDVLPRSVVIIGAGRTGLDYAMLLARIGIEVTVVDEQSTPAELYGNLMINTRLFDAQSLDIAFRLGDEVIGIQTGADGWIAAHLASGKTLTADVALVCVTREGLTAGLDLELAGVGLDEHQRVWCNAHGQTWAPNIRAIGDVVGFRSKKALAG